MGVMAVFAEDAVPWSNQECQQGRSQASAEKQRQISGWRCAVAGFHSFICFSTTGPAKAGADSLKSFRSSLRVSDQIPPNPFL
jgi:hypothetical protein